MHDVLIMRTSHQRTWISMQNIWDLISAAFPSCGGLLKRRATHHYQLTGPRILMPMGSCSTTAQLVAALTTAKAKYDEHGKRKRLKLGIDNGQFTKAWACQTGACAGGWLCLYNRCSIRERS